MENLVKSLVNLFGGLGKEIIVFIISMMPILELRGGLIAAALLKMNFIPSYVISIIYKLFSKKFFPELGMSCSSSISSIKFSNSIYKILIRAIKKCFR